MIAYRHRPLNLRLFTSIKRHLLPLNCRTNEAEWTSKLTQINHSLLAAQERVILSLQAPSKIVEDDIANNFFVIFQTTYHVNHLHSNDSHEVLGLIIYENQKKLRSSSAAFITGFLWVKWDFLNWGILPYANNNNRNRSTWASMQSDQ